MTPRKAHDHAQVEYRKMKNMKLTRTFESPPAVASRYCLPPAMIDPAVAEREVAAVLLEAETDVEVEVEAGLTSSSVSAARSLLS